MPRLILLCSLLFSLASCEVQNQNIPLLQTQPEEETGVDFVNELIETDSFNIIVQEYIYNGGGVGVGDFDRNGLPDLVFSGNRVSSELYLQTTPWEFKKITVEAGLTTTDWCAGVSILDLDENGYEDIYFSTLNLNGERNVANLLFLNQGPDENGIPQFTEAAKTVGVADSSYCTQAAWLDVDMDGDLDLYQLNNGLEKYNRNVARGQDISGKGNSLDHFYLNQGKGTDGLPRFKKMPLDFGIKKEGWGLGVAVQDFNQDGYPDVYTANDFLSNDNLWMNRQGEGFSNEIDQVMTHQSYNSMGVDVADLNNDGYPEVMVVDMLPDDNARIKSMFADQNYDREDLNTRRGYQQQYVRNVLQLNNADGTFSDIGYMAGVAGTDWSWAPLLCDLDNDGWRDIYVTNGYPKDITDQDFASYNQNASMFGTREAKKARATEILKGLKGVHQANYCFKNLGNLDFKVATSDWTSNVPSYSNGAVFVDLDLDGDLDLVTNNINEPASLLRNYTRERDPENSQFIRLQLKGPTGNPHGLGAAVKLINCNGEIRTHQHYRVRGYLSSVEQTIHFGLGATSCGEVKELIVTWPDGTSQSLNNVRLDTIVEMTYSVNDGSSKSSALFPLVATASPVGTIPYTEDDFNDFNFQYLLQRRHSEEGPHLAPGDIDGDGDDDLIIGGPAGQSVRIFHRDGDNLRPISAPGLISTEAPETSALALFDADGDGDLDLYVANGSSEFIRNPDLMKDQLFLNDGSGNFISVATELPHPATFTGCLAIADVDADGDLDVFAGGRMVPGEFPRSPSSYLLINDGAGNFIDGTADWSLSLGTAGMLTDAAWADFNADGLPDLITAGEYTPVRLWSNKGKGLATARQIAPVGWWQSLLLDDWDEDGDLDVFVGNVGLNGPLRATTEQPVCIVAADYDSNGSIDPIVTAYNGEKAYPVHPRNTLTRQLPKWKQQIPNFATYGKFTAADLPKANKAIIELCATEFRSLLLSNDGTGNFTASPLPNEVQLSPVRAMAKVGPWLYGLGNDYATETVGGRYDAGTGFGLIRNSDGWAVSINEFNAPGDVHDLVILQSKDGKPILVIGGQEEITYRYWRGL